MNFMIFIISIAILSGFVGSAFAQQSLEHQEFSQEEIDKMKNKAVLITMHEVTFTIQLFPEDAPNTVYNFLKLVEDGFYDGIVFHRIIPGFMIQAGDPNTKDPESDRSLWGTGGPGYLIKEEFNTIQHDRGIVSMARSNDPNSAGSQFFIMHQDNNLLDGQYTAFGRLVPGTYSHKALDHIALLDTAGNEEVPLDILQATIQQAKILDPYFPPPGLGEPDRNPSLTKIIQRHAGKVHVYHNQNHDVIFDIPYKWDVIEKPGSYLNLIIEPSQLEHNVQKQIEESGFIPQVFVSSEERNPMESAGVSTAFFSLRGGEDPKVLGNYVFETDDGRKARLVTTTQQVQTPTGTVQFKVIQLNFINTDRQYSIIYVNVSDWFRYELNAFRQVVSNFEIIIDGKMQPINFDQTPVFRQLFADAMEKPEPEPLPPARIDSGCLIATAAFGSEMAPQVQFLREIRDNTVLQTQSGTSFMTTFNQFYYSFSPVIADYERENVAFKEAVKLTLTPLLTSLTLLQYADIDSESEMLGYGIGVILLNIGMYFIAPAVLITKIRSFYKLQ